MLTDSLWQECLEQLAKKVKRNLYNIWIKPVQAEVAEDFSKVILYFPSRFKLNYYREQFLVDTSKILAQLYGQPITIKLEVKADSKELESISNLAAISIQDGESKKPVVATKKMRSENNIDVNLNFDNLVEGSANRMAKAAAMYVSNMTEQIYNPLFIYGGVGLGKTHIMHAIGNQLLSINKQAKVLYIHSERFVSDVVKGYQHKNFDSFRNKYHSLDLLLIDDVQFFAGKERSQEEFFNAFEALLAKQSQIVLTSDTYPKGLLEIHERLRSRFDSGLTVVLDPPELELRVAILKSKAKQDKAKLPEEVAFFIAKHVRSNVRELEGALRKVLAYSKFNGKTLTIDVAKQALRDLLSIQNRLISIEGIQKTVADYYKIKVADMHSKKRPTNIARPRQIAMYLAKELTQKSYPEIGEMFGGRDHTTVLHAVRKISEERAKFDDLARELSILEQTLKN